MNELLHKIQELKENHNTTSEESKDKAVIKKPTKKALLIGINYYNSTSALQGCQEDVRNIQKFLQTKGFTSFNILIDSANDRYHKNPDCPTRSNIITAMKSLVAGAVAGDTLWVHYSGHGTQLPSKDKWEKDGLDECICPVDFDFNKPDSGFIRDNYLNDILVASLPVGVKLRVVFDSCHSGSALDLPYMWSTGINTTRESDLIADRDVIFISGCRDNQTSADANINGKATGAMTWSLLKTLSELPSNNNITWENMLELMRKNLIKGGYNQIPQLSIENPSQLKNIIDI
jgi:hypothetical protein